MSCVFLSKFVLSFDKTQVYFYLFIGYVYATIHNSQCIYYTVSAILLTNICVGKGVIVNPKYNWNM